MKYFMRDESASHPGKWVIRPIHENFHLSETTGSYNLICARLLSISYANYLRLCRDEFGAEIIGKNSNYPVAYFNRSKELDALIDLLNARANAVIWKREHPDYDAHAEYVKEHAPEYYKKVTGNE